MVTYVIQMLVLLLHTAKALRIVDSRSLWGPPSPTPRRKLLKLVESCKRVACQSESLRHQANLKIPFNELESSQQVTFFPTLKRPTRPTLSDPSPGLALTPSSRPPSDLPWPFLNLVFLNHGH